MSNIRDFIIEENGVLTKYSGRDIDVIIPYGVTSIGESAFCNCSSLTTITIPHSVTSIGDWAFFNCCSLTTITIPDSVTSIGESAFCNCSYNFTICAQPGSYAEKYAKNSCKKFTAIQFPSEEKTTTRKADSTGNEKVYYKEEAPGAGGFDYPSCKPIASVNPDGNNTNSNTPGYSSVDGVLYNKSKTVLVRFPLVKNSNHHIAGSVTSIGVGAFEGCRHIRRITTSYFLGVGEVVVPDCLKSIGDNAFSNCPRLELMQLPDGVASVGKCAFKDCENLSVIELPDSISRIDEGAFENCQSLYSIRIPAGVTSISNGTFRNCRELTSVIFPKGITHIGENAFEGCRSLKSITIPEGVTSIGDNAFEGCSSLESITLPCSVTHIGDNVFRGCTKLGNIEVPESDS